MTTVRVGGFLFGSFSMSRAEFDRRVGGKPAPTVTIKVAEHGWEHIHIEVRPRFDGDQVHFTCDETTIWAKRPLVTRIDR